MFTLINKIGDLFLSEDPDTRSWLNDRQIVCCWHVFFYAFLLTLFCIHILFSFLDTTNVAVHANIYRAANLTCFGTLDILWIILTFFYYNNLLRTGKDLNFFNILWLFAVAIILFSKTYYYIYCLFPHYLNYIDAPYKPMPTLQRLPTISTFELTIDFLIYSAANMYNSSYWKIRSASTYVSFVNVIQSLYGLLFIAIIFSTYVGKQINTKVKNARDRH